MTQRGFFSLLPLHSGHPVQLHIIASTKPFSKRVVFNLQLRYLKCTNTQFEITFMSTFIFLLHSDTSIVFLKKYIHYFGKNKKAIESKSHLLIFVSTQTS